MRLKAKRSRDKGSQAKVHKSIQRLEGNQRQVREEREKQCLKDNAFLRKVKSSKNLGITSESEEVTFELSSEA